MKYTFGAFQQNTSPVHLASAYGAMAVAVAQVYDGSPSQASWTSWLGCGSSSIAAFLLNLQTVDRSPWWQKPLQYILHHAHSLQAAGYYNVLVSTGFWY
jgi:hypothetical protein